MPVQGNTIDFDSARVKLGHSSTQQRRNGKPAATFQNTQRNLMQNLQTSLELDRVLQVFFSALQDLLLIDSLEYRHTSVTTPLLFGQPGLHRCSYRMSHAGNYLGELQLSRQTRFAEDELLSIEGLLATLMFPLRNALLYREALACALNDTLTGAGNRLALNQNLERDIRSSKRSGQPLSLMVLDVDHFKSVNDRYGHAYGDEALKAMVDCVTATLRNVDCLYRLGGEEFVVLLNNTDAEACHLVAERIRQSIEELQFQIDGQPLPMTASLGHATLRSQDDARSLLDRADQRMYQAKRNGRNQVIGTE
ncbi:GGDEF domain-containing protein [Halopseudomonas oceani]|uniref:GGDEF domain-containing protein n=1 Tax=Halopseudomonas oceani TaxID=1708783 RepID=UPI002AA953DA|nr:GGDEF domain-containing protein [Halopseudomonas oceani]